MARFPTREADVAALAGNVIVGLTESGEDFPRLGGAYVGRHINWTGMGRSMQPNRRRCAAGRQPAWQVGQSHWEAGVQCRQDGYQVPAIDSRDCGSVAMGQRVQGDPGRRLTSITEEQ